MLIIFILTIHHQKELRAVRSSIACFGVQGANCKARVGVGVVRPSPATAAAAVRSKRRCNQERGPQLPSG